MMTFPFILLLFSYLALTIGVAWCGSYRLSCIMFVIFLIAYVLIFWHHVSDPLQITL